MLDAPGRFVCGRDYRESDKHNTEEVTAAVKCIKEKALKAFLTVEDLDQLVRMFQPTEDGRETENDLSEREDEVHWVEEQQDRMFYILHLTDCINMDKDVELLLSNASFVHGSSFSLNIYKP